MLEGARPGTVVVDMSSINPMVSQKMAAACETKGVKFIDAPVSGGQPKAIDGTLAIMAGGKQAVTRAGGLQSQERFRLTPNSSMIFNSVGSLSRGRKRRLLI